MIPWFQFSIVQLGPIPFQVWGFFVALGMVLSMYLIKKQAIAAKIPVEPLLSLALRMIIFGVIGARLFHVFFYEPAYFVAHPFEIIAVWHGGMSSFGGLVGALVAVFLLFKKKIIDNTYIPLYSNILSYAALFGWMVGRIGCLMIHDHLGAESTSFLAFDSPYGKRLDMAFLEILGLIPLAVVFYILKRKKIGHLSTPLLFVYYGILRFILDFWRADSSFATGDTRYLGLTPAQYFAMVLVVFGVYLFQKSNRKK